MSRLFHSLKMITTCWQRHCQLAITSLLNHWCPLKQLLLLFMQLYRQTVRVLEEEEPFACILICPRVRLSPLLLSLSLAFRENLACLDNQLRKVVVVVNICNVEILFCSLVGRTQFFPSEQRTHSLSRFQIEPVVTNQTKDLSITIDSIIAKHFLGYYVTSSRTLVNNVLHEVYTACHVKIPIYQSFFFFTSSMASLPVRCSMSKRIISMRERPCSISC